VSEEGSLRVVVIHEPLIDHQHGDAFKLFLEREVFGSPSDVVLHLLGVTYLSSVALGLISLAAVMTEKRGIQFVVVCDREEVLKLFVISGLYKAVKISSSVDSARVKIGHPVGAASTG
jgi:anti-anti-sigma factor